MCDFCPCGILQSNIRTFRRNSSAKQSVQQRRNKTTVVYSRLEVWKDKSWWTNANNAPLTNKPCVVDQCHSLLEWIDRIDLMNIYIDSSVLWLSDEYRALSEYRRGDFSSSLRTCSAVLKLHYQKTSEILHVFCSESFSLLLDGDLKQIIERTISLEEQVGVYPIIVMLY